jgi:hypothetical protein
MALFIASAPCHESTSHLKLLLYCNCTVEVDGPADCNQITFHCNSMTKRKAIAPKGIDEEAECEDGSDEGSDGEEENEEDNDFIVGDGDLSDSHYCSPIPSPPTKKARGRPPGKTKDVALSDKPPGDSAYPVNDFSLTVTRTKADVGLDAFQAIGDFIDKFSIKGGVSTEVGQRMFNLHLQGVFRMHWPATKEYSQRLQKMVKGLLPAQGKLYKVLVKVFGRSQSFSAMVGYITKDQGASMYLSPAAG